MNKNLNRQIREHKPYHDKTMWFPNRSVTNQAVQAQKSDDDWKLEISDIKRRGIVLYV